MVTEGHIRHDHLRSEFEAAKDLLICRYLAWADEHGMSADGMVLSAALDSRHRSRDGRLAYWGPDQVRRFRWGGFPCTS